MRIGNIILIFLFFSGGVFAQDPADIFYVTVEMDSINQLAVEAYAGDSLAVEPWAGDHLLIETNVLLHNGKQNMLGFFKEQGRWAFAEERSGERLTLRATDLVRRTVQSTKGGMEEEILIVIYLPEEFEDMGNNLWSREPE